MNDSIINLLNELQTYSYYIKQLNLKQAAGDYDYIVAWFKSSEFTKDGSHLPPNPAGEDTIDPYSNNCPIPYTRNYNLSNCYDADKAVIYLTRIYEILNTLLNEVSDEIETVAVNSYVEYTYTIIENLGGEVDPPGPEPPGPTPPENRHISAGLLDDADDLLCYCDMSGMMAVNGYLSKDIELLDSNFSMPGFIETVVNKPQMLTLALKENSTLAANSNVAIYKNNNYDLYIPGTAEKIPYSSSFRLGAVQTEFSAQTNDVAHIQTNHWMVENSTLSYTWYKPYIELCDNNGYLAVKRSDSSGVSATYGISRVLLYDNSNLPQQYALTRVYPDVDSNPYNISLGSLTFTVDDNTYWWIVKDDTNDYVIYNGDGRPTGWKA